MYISFLCGCDLAIPESAEGPEKTCIDILHVDAEERNVQGYFLSPLAGTVSSQNPAGSREDKGQPYIFNEI